MGSFCGTELPYQPMTVFPEAYIWTFWYPGQNSDPTWYRILSPFKANVLSLVLVLYVLSDPFP
jgi:hypothetical protein